MCGIVGHIDTSWPNAQSEALVRRQLNRMRYRGPDDDGVLVSDSVALGHVRLAIIDPAGGGQPMTTPDGNLAITFNGEIYNYTELRSTLESKGHTFRTNSDTEVLLHGYREWGSLMASKLNGMFAFGIHDKTNNTLYLARDPYGQKPLFYTEISGSFHFASESKAFLDIPDFSGRIDPESVAHYLSFEALYYDRSIYENVSKLPPGHYLFRSQGFHEVRRYHRSIPRETNISLAEAEEQADQAMHRAVTLAYRADVPVGVLLSGGLDSTLILAYLSQAYPNKSISTFTIKVDDPTYDESGYARMAADLFATDHHEVPLGLGALAQCATSLPARLDEPIADPGILPMHTICDTVAKHCKVALTGVGGDEIFYGYISFKAEKLARLYELLPEIIHKRLIRPIIERLPCRDGYMKLDFLAKQFAKGFPAPRGLRNFQWTCSLDQYAIGNLFTDPAVGNISTGLIYLQKIFSEATEAGSLGKFAYQYQRSYLPDYILPNSDRASMLHSVELRTPFLDPHLVDTVNAIPDRWKMKGLTTKTLMKSIAARYLPYELIHRKKKGFTVPVANMLRTSLREELCDLLSHETLVRQGLFNPVMVQDLLKTHLTGQANRYKPLWTLFVFQKWLSEGTS